jgi:hypothetical protein
MEMPQSYLFLLSFACSCGPFLDVKNKRWGRLKTDMTFSLVLLTFRKDISKSSLVRKIYSEMKAQKCCFLNDYWKNIGSGFLLMSTITECWVLLSILLDFHNFHKTTSSEKDGLSTVRRLDECFDYFKILRMMYDFL